MCRVKRDYNQDFSRYVKYDENSLTGLVWVKSFRKMIIGKQAGTLGSSGQSSYVRINKEAYLCHRIIWKLFHDNVSQSLVIDHINGNPRDNRIDNLRLVTTADNLRNKAISSKNTSGVTGVYFTKANGTSSYVASVSSESGKVGKNKRSFSVFKYGEKQAKQLAIDWRKNKLLELEQQSIFYSERHGTKNEDIISTQLHKDKYD